MNVSFYKIKRGKRAAPALGTGVVLSVAEGFGSGLVSFPPPGKPAVFNTHPSSGQALLEFYRVAV